MQSPKPENADGTGWKTADFWRLQGFEVLVTPVQNIRYQQNLAARKIALVVLGQGRWTLVKNYAAQIADAVEAATPGSYREVKIPLRQPQA
jgi:hypothetical protein